MKGVIMVKKTARTIGSVSNSFFICVIAALVVTFCLVYLTSCSEGTVTENKNYKIGDTVIMQYTGTREVLSGNSEIVSNVNNSISRIQNRFRDNRFEKARVRFEKGEEHFPHTVDIDVKTYESGDYYSFRLRVSGDFGGAHPADRLYGYTYRKSNGKRIAALSLIKDRGELLRRIQSAFFEKLKETEENPLDRYSQLNIDNTTLDSFTYYLNDGFIYANYNFGSVTWLTGTVKVNIC